MKPMIVILCLLFLALTACSTTPVSRVPAQEDEEFSLLCENKRLMLYVSSAQLADLAYDYDQEGPPEPIRALMMTLYKVTLKEKPEEGEDPEKLTKLFKPIKTSVNQDAPSGPAPIMLDYCGPHSAMEQDIISGEKENGRYAIKLISNARRSGDLRMRRMSELSDEEKAELERSLHSKRILRIDFTYIPGDDGPSLTDIESSEIGY